MAHGVTVRLELARPLDSTRAFLTQHLRPQIPGVHCNLSTTIAHSVRSLNAQRTRLHRVGLSVHKQLIAANATVALASPGAAQLWACCLEACEGEVASVEALATAITAGCAAVAGLLLANALGV